MSIPAMDYVDEEERDRADRIERQNAEDREYLAAKCKEPHKDGSRCMPDWDGIMFVCFHQILQGYGEPVNYS